MADPGPGPRAPGAPGADEDPTGDGHGAWGTPLDAGPGGIGEPPLPDHAGEEVQPLLSGQVVPGLDTSRPHPARIYDYWVGGKDHFAADRRIGAQVAERAPWVISGARGNRAFLARAVSYLAESGVDQLLDIGAGLPGVGNVHEVAQAVNPSARTVYVDRDEIVLAHARALLARDARTIAVGGDARDPGAILDHPDVRAHLDLDRPVGVLLVAVLHFITADAEATRITATLRDRLAPGSHLVISHVADLPDDRDRPERAEATRAAAELYDSLAAPFTLRTPEQIAALFDGFDLVPPGVVPAHRWHPHRGRPGPAIPVLAGVGRLSTPVTLPGPGSHQGDHSGAGAAADAAGDRG